MSVWRLSPVQAKWLCHWGHRYQGLSLYVSIWNANFGGSKCSGAQVKVIKLLFVVLLHYSLLLEFYHIWFLFHILVSSFKKWTTDRPYLNQ
jgi:hypothetical protein